MGLTLKKPKTKPLKECLVFLYWKLKKTNMTTKRSWDSCHQQHKMDKKFQWKEPYCQIQIFTTIDTNSLILQLSLNKESLSTATWNDIDTLSHLKGNFFNSKNNNFLELNIHPHCPSLPSLINFKLRVLNRSREYCLDAFLQSVPAFIIAANSS